MQRRVQPQPREERRRLADKVIGVPARLAGIVCQSVSSLTRRSPWRRHDWRQGARHTTATSELPSPSRNQLRQRWPSCPVCDHDVRCQRLSLASTALQMRIDFIAIPPGKRRSCATRGCTTERRYLMPSGDDWLVAGVKLMRSPRARRAPERSRLLVVGVLQDGVYGPRNVAVERHGEAAGQSG